MKHRLSHPSGATIQKRYFKCPECGFVQPATKGKGTTNIGHIKTMYCYKCKEKRDFVQID